MMVINKSQVFFDSTVTSEDIFFELKKYCDAEFFESFAIYKERYGSNTILFHIVCLKNVWWRCVLRYDMYKRVLEWRSTGNEILNWIKYHLGHYIAQKMKVKQLFCDLLNKNVAPYFNNLYRSFKQFCSFKISLYPSLATKFYFKISIRTTIEYWRLRKTIN